MNYSIETINPHKEQTLPSNSFFDLQRAAVIRDSPSIRLRRAVKEGNIAAVKRLLKKVTNIQNPDPETGCTTLMYAAQYGHVELVELLLELGHEEEVISVDNEGITVLMIAAMYNHEEIFFLYVSKYPECIHAISKNGWTALLYAAQNGNANLVSYLLSISADYDHVDNEGNSALHYASAWGHVTVMDLLISEGCNVDLENNEHLTAFDYAYSNAVQEHLKEMSQATFNDDSTISASSSRQQQHTNNFFASNITNSRGTSYAGYESPIPCASTSSSSLVIPPPQEGSLAASPRGSNQIVSGSPSSGYSELLERRRASSFGDTKSKRT
ncbi:ankyrin repeat-containing domain protein [Cokeromyces recurvatus]|uniref:ankyrin repeat-containing domain protein n=1 Tax=Cokeromyces recurvatus TaxID=90255 RepID=UPI002220314C|nr:ankyrin repeat-containing domain protein [Cokeromyces recurvatus]KAI7897841.1 ankyrin repeat-containing domain protein [Cokeromyces recurvatus]